MFRYRRRAGTTLATLIAAATVGPAMPSAAQPDAELAGAVRVAQLTGPGSINETDVRYQVKGADLGIMWQGGRRQLRIAFGDTFGAAWSGPDVTSTNPADQDWRSNTLARSSDSDPSDGVTFDDFVTDRPGHARELVPSRKRDHDEISTIPTGGVHVNGRDYLAYMSVRHFEPQGGRWITNHSGIAYSDDNGQTWVDVSSARRPNTPALDDRFQMITYAQRDGAPRNGDGYVYAIGTPNGRFGAAYLARVPEDQLLEPEAYEYWTTPGGWRRGNSDIATPIVPGPVGELSVRYNESLAKWMMMTLDENRGAIVLRLAPELTGPWGPPMPLATGRTYPSLYGGFLHPASNGTEIYFTMTRYSEYNVWLMRARLPRDVQGVLWELPVPGSPPGPELPVSESLVSESPVSESPVSESPGPVARS